MDNEEAKFILRAYRSNGVDAGDPAFNEALQQAQRDPSLGQWLAREQALDQAVARKLKSVAPPAGLRESILAGAKVSRRPRSWWQSPAWMAAAAMIAVAFGAIFAWQRLPSSSEASELASWAISDSQSEGHQGMRGASEAFRATITDRSTRLASVKLPLSFEEMRSAGCRTARFAGRDVLEVCFVREGKEFHLYVANRIRNVPTQPRFVEKTGALAAVWGDGEHAFVLSTNAGLEALKQVL